MAGIVEQQIPADEYAAYVHSVREKGRHQGNPDSHTFDVLTPFPPCRRTVELFQNEVLITDRNLEDPGDKEPQRIYRITPQVSS